MASPHTSRLANASRSNRVQHRFVYGLVFRFRLLSTPHLDDAVTFGYGQASAPVRKGLSTFCWCVLSGALVDDDELLRDLFGGALRKKGYHVIEADSGVEGFEKAQKNLPDLILSDICMPGRDGTTLVRNIRDDPELRSTEVVVMSGMPDQLVPRTGTEEGADDFLMKPVSLKELLSCVQARLLHASLCCPVLA